MLRTWQTVTLRAFVFCPEADLAKQFLRAVDPFREFSLLRSFDSLPSSEDAARLASLYAPNCVVLSVANPEEAGRVVNEMRQALPGIQFVALHNTSDPELLLQIMRTGIPEFLSSPFKQDAIRETFNRMRTVLSDRTDQSEGTKLVYSFLPAKPGGGTTTLAVNSAIAAARKSAGPVFFGDFDLSMGVTRFMLKLDADLSVVDAASRDVVDEAAWARLISRRHKVDFMHAGRLQPDTRVAPAQAARLLELLRRPYHMVVADLSGNFEKYSIEIMRQSRKIFLVTTPELPAIHLARDRVNYLRELDLGDRVSVLLNRVVRRGVLSEIEISNLIGVPIDYSFVNDYSSVSRALHEAQPIPEKTELGRQIAEFSDALLDEQSMKKPAAPRRFLEFFSLSSTRLRAQPR